MAISPSPPSIPTADIKTELLTERGRSHEKLQPAAKSFFSSIRPSVNPAYYNTRYKKDCIAANNIAPFIAAYLFLPAANNILLGFISPSSLYSASLWKGSGIKTFEWLNLCRSKQPAESNGIIAKDDKL